MSGVGREFLGISAETATRTVFVGVSLPSEGVDVPTPILGPGSRW